MTVERTHTLTIRPRVAAVRAESRMFTPDSRQVREGVSPDSHGFTPGSRGSLIRLARGSHRIRERVTPDSHVFTAQSRESHTAFAHVHSCLDKFACGRGCTLRGSMNIHGSNIRTPPPPSRRHPCLARVVTSVVLVCIFIVSDTPVDPHPGAPFPCPQPRTVPHYAWPSSVRVVTSTFSVM